MPGRHAGRHRGVSDGLADRPPFPGGAPQPGTGLDVDARPRAGCDCGVSKGDRGVSQDAAGPNPISGRRTSTWGLPTRRCPAGRPTPLRSIQTALRMKPDSALAHFHLGNTFQKMGRLQEAIEEYRTALRINPDATGRALRTGLCVGADPRPRAEAIAECQEMLRLSPNDGPGRELMASLLAFQNSQHQIP